VVARKVTVKLNRHLGKNTTDGIFSITRNMDVALIQAVNQIDYFNNINIKRNHSFTILCNV